MIEEEMQEEIINNTAKEWLLNPIKIVATEENDIKLRQGFKSKYVIENLFYRDFDALVDAMNKYCDGYYHIKVNNINIEVIDGQKPIDEDDE